MRAEGSVQLTSSLLVDHSLARNWRRKPYPGRLEIVARVDRYAADVLTRIAYAAELDARTSGAGSKKARTIGNGLPLA